LRRIIVSTTTLEAAMARGWSYWKCKLNLSHNWEVQTSEDGGRWVECTECHKEKMSLADNPGAG
jgi:hypothetical protein